VDFTKKNVQELIASNAMIPETSSDDFSNLTVGSIFAQKRKYGPVNTWKIENGQIYGFIIGNHSKVIFE
jgi:hypothetical protein